MNPRSSGRPIWKIGAPTALQMTTHLKLARQKTCKTLLQVKQSFCHPFKVLCGFALGVLALNPFAYSHGWRAAKV